MYHLTWKYLNIIYIKYTHWKRNNTVFILIGCLFWLYLLFWLSWCLYWFWFSSYIPSPISYERIHKTSCIQKVGLICFKHQMERVFDSSLALFSFLITLALTLWGYSSSLLWVLYFLMRIKGIINRVGGEERRRVAGPHFYISQVLMAMTSMNNGGWELEAHKSGVSQPQPKQKKGFASKTAAASGMIINRLQNQGFLPHTLPHKSW